MPGDLTISQARLVMPDRIATGDLVIQEGVITGVGPRLTQTVGEVIDGRGLTVLPGAVDADVCMADPAPEGVEDLHSGTRAAAAGGVTSIILRAPPDAPVCDQATLDARLKHASRCSLVNYGFYLSASEAEVATLAGVRRHAGLLVQSCQGPELLEELLPSFDCLFSVQCDPRASASELLRSTRLAVEASRRHGRRMHLLRLSTSGELDLLHALGSERLSASVSVPHLFLDAEQGAGAVPPVAESHHARSLWRGLREGLLSCISSAHAATAPGLPALELTLPLLLDMVAKDELDLSDVARWTSERPARCMGISRKGRLEVGYDGDIVVVDEGAARRVGSGHSAWSTNPWEGQILRGWPVLTAVKGTPVYREGEFTGDTAGRELSFTS